MGILNSMLESKVSDKIVLTPVKIATDMVEILPEDVWNKDTKFLDHCCKGGVYLKLIYDKLMKKLSNVIENEDARSSHILNSQLYGLGMDEFCTAVSQRRLYGRMDSNKNIKYIKNYTRMVQGSIKEYKEELERAFGENMRFDVVISNPPYNRGMDLDFVYKGFLLSDKYTVMITPAKWQTAADDQRVASKTINYKGFREKLVPHMSKVVFYPDCKDLFDIYQTDGITFFILDKNNKVDKCNIENISKTRGEVYNSEEVRSIENGESLLNIGNEIILSMEPYRKFSFPFISGRKQFKVLTNTQVSGYDWYTEGGPRYVISISRILNTGCGDTYDGEVKEIFEADTRQECESFVSWLNTRFTRFFLVPNISKLTGILCDHCFRFVPAPPSIPSGNPWDHIYTDQELYNYFQLPQKYIDVIEAVIKERDITEMIK